MARTQQQLAGQYRVTGDLVVPDAAGEPTLGRFTLETSLARSEPAAAIALLRAGIEQQNGRLLDKWA